MIRIVEKQIDQLSKYELGRMKILCFRCAQYEDDYGTYINGSFMKHCLLDDLRNHLLYGIKNLSRRYFLAYFNNVVIGWSYITYDIKTHAELMVYVQRSFRRLGIGKKLVKRAQKFLEKDKIIPEVYLHSEEAISFYSKCGRIPKIRKSSYGSTRKLRKAF